MQLSDLSTAYVQENYHPDMGDLIRKSFGVLGKFNNQDMESKYVDLISVTESMDNSTKSDTFVMWVKKDLLEVIELHGISLDSDADILHNELVELVDFLNLLSNLEDYDYVGYMSNSANSNKLKFIYICGKYSYLSELRLREIIKSVNDKFIEAIQKLSEQEEEPTASICSTHIARVNIFAKFINDTDCLGLRLFHTGYVSYTLEEVTSLVTMDVSEHVERMAVTHLGQATLDVLSLLMISKDCSSDPLNMFKANYKLFTQSTETFMKMSQSLATMTIDFENYAKAAEQGELINDQARIS